jgi:hypothetical protein
MTAAINQTDAAKARAALFAAMPDALSVANGEKWTLAPDDAIRHHWPVMSSRYPDPENSALARDGDLPVAEAFTRARDGFTVDLVRDNSWNVKGVRVIASIVWPYDDRAKRAYGYRDVMYQGMPGYAPPPDPTFDVNRPAATIAKTIWSRLCTAHYAEMRKRLRDRIKREHAEEEFRLSYIAVTTAEIEAALQVEHSLPGENYAPKGLHLRRDEPNAPRKVSLNLPHSPAQAVEMLRAIREAYTRITGTPA